MVMGSEGLWVAVESARESGGCIGRRLVRVRIEESGMRHFEARDGLSGEWRAITEPVPEPNLGHSCAAVGSLLYVVGGAGGGK